MFIYSIKAKIIFVICYVFLKLIKLQVKIFYHNGKTSTIFSRILQIYFLCIIVAFFYSKIMKQNKKASNIHSLRSLTNFVIFRQNIGGHFTLMEQVAGIEPVLLAWEAKVLPLNYTCKETLFLLN